MKGIHIFILSVIAIVVIALMPGVLATQDAWPAGVTKVINIPACAFLPPDNETDYYADGARFFIKGGGAKYVRAPLILPNGAKIKQVVLVCKDSDPEGDIRLWVHRVSNDQSDSKAIANVASSDESEDWRSFSTTSFDEDRIDNINYCTFINVRLLESPEQLLVLGHVKVYYKGKW